MKKKFYILIATVLLIHLSIASTVSAKDTVDATNWEDNLITCTGIGRPPSNAFSHSYARIYARQAATLDAYLLMAECLLYTGDYKINFNTEMAYKFSKVCKIKNIKYNTDGSVEVTLQMPLFY